MLPSLSKARLRKLRHKELKEDFAISCKHQWLFCFPASHWILWVTAEFPDAATSQKSERWVSWLAVLRGEKDRPAFNHSWVFISNNINTEQAADITTSEAVDARERCAWLRIGCVCVCNNALVRQIEGMKTLKWFLQWLQGSGDTREQPNYRPSSNRRHPQTEARVTTRGKSKNGKGFIFRVRL